MSGDYKFIGEFFLIGAIYLQSDDGVNVWFTRGVAVIGCILAYVGILP